MIRFQDVTKVYADGTEAVRGMSFEVEEGEICVLLGPSGCGKTTVMKMINRLIPITGGRIFVRGTDNTEMDPDELRKDMGYAIQNVGLFPHMTVGENIETVPVLRGWKREDRRNRVRELLELLRMDPDEFAGKYPKELSGGQRQRVGVARALGADPPILLMDEPFGAIDPITRVQLQDEFLSIQEEIRKTVIFVTHDIYEAIRLGDKIALMKGGRLVQYGPPGELLFNPQDEFVAGFVGADRALKGLQLIRAKEVLWASPPQVDPDDTADAVSRRLEQESVQWAAIADGAGKFLGYATPSQMESGQKAKDAAAHPQAAVADGSVLNESLSLMLSTGLDMIAVVDRQGRLQGAVTFHVIQETLTEATRKYG